nr:hypothetical protein [Pseudoalteromonas telluritireducens]
MINHKKLFFTAQLRQVQRYLMLQQLIMQALKVALVTGTKPTQPLFLQMLTVAQNR